MLSKLDFFYFILLNRGFKSDSNSHKMTIKLVFIVIIFALLNEQQIDALPETTLKYVTLVMDLKLID